MERFRKLLNLIGRDHLRRWALLALSAVLVGVLELIGALLVFALISAILDPSTEISLPVVGSLSAVFGRPSRDRFLILLGVTVAVFSVIRAIVFLGQTYLQQRMAHNAAAGLSDRLFGAYLRMPYQLHLTRNSSVLLRNVNQSVMEVALYGFVPLVTIASEIMLGLGIAVALIVTSPVVTGALLLVATPIMVLFLRVSRKAFVKLGTTSQEASATSLRYSQESLHGIRDIKVLGREGFFGELFNGSRARLARALYIRSVLTELPRASIEGLFMVALSLLLVLSVQNGSGEEAIASLGLMAYAGIRLMPSLNRIVANISHLQFASAAINNVHDELAEVGQQISAPSDSDRRLALTRELRFDQVAFRYEPGGTDILSNISFAIARGSSVGIVGPTGAGKSTLLDLMMGLLQPTEGAVVVDDVSIEQETRAWQMSLGVVPQTPFLLDDSLRRNVALGVPDNEIDDQKVLAALDLAQLGSFLPTLPDGLATKLGEHGLRLSGGQRQRVAIARALYRDPEVLILDEATSALDRVTEKRFIEDLERLKPGSTVVIVSHRLSALSECQQILLLKDGRLVDVGSFKELRARNSLFREMAN